MRRAWQQRSAALVLAGAVALIGNGACGWWYVEPRAAPVEVRRQAPEISLPNHTGKVVTLSGLLAQGPVVLIFYRGHW